MILTSRNEQIINGIGIKSPIRLNATLLMHYNSERRIFDIDNRIIYTAFRKETL